MIGKRKEKEILDESSSIGLSAQARDLSYIIYEYCPKMDLFSYVASGHTVRNEALCHSLFVQVLSSMAFLHKDCTTAHLDIKLENIVVDRNFILKLIDFAFCENLRENMCVSKGTERYFAPEVAHIYYNSQHVWKGCRPSRPLTYVAEESDIFALGILLFTMYFGQPPFYQNTVERSPLLAYLGSGNMQLAEVFFQTHEVTREANELGEISFPMKALLVKMLAVDPSKRWRLIDLVHIDDWI